MTPRVSHAQLPLRHKRGVNRCEILKFLSRVLAGHCRQARRLASYPKSPSFTLRKNAFHSGPVNTSAGPSGNLEFRTATPSATWAASTQLPLGLLKLLLCHIAAGRSDARTPLGT